MANLLPFGDYRSPVLRSGYDNRGRWHQPKASGVNLIATWFALGAVSWGLVLGFVWFAYKLWLTIARAL